LAHKTPSYDTNMLTKVVIDKTVFVKFKINNNISKTFMKQIQNNNKKSIGKSIPAYEFLLS
jgi:hypothetical protein